MTPGLSAGATSTSLAALCYGGRLTEDKVLATLAALALLRLGDGRRIDGLSLAVLGRLGGAGAGAGRASKSVARGHVVRLGAGRDGRGGGDAGRVAVPAVVLVAAAVLAVVLGAVLGTAAVVVLAVVLVLVLAVVVGTTAVAVEATRRADGKAAAQALRVRHRVRHRTLRVRLAHDLRRDALLLGARGLLAVLPVRLGLGGGLRLAGSTSRVSGERGEASERK